MFIVTKLKRTNLQSVILNSIITVYAEHICTGIQQYSPFLQDLRVNGDRVPYFLSQAVRRASLELTGMVSSKIVIEGSSRSDRADVVEIS